MWYSTLAAFILGYLLGRLHAWLPRPPHPSQPLPVVPADLKGYDESNPKKLKKTTMREEEDLPPPPATLSKKAAKKEALKAERLRKKQEEEAAPASALDPVSLAAAADPFSSNYGDIPMVELQSKTISTEIYTKIAELDASLAGQTVLIAGRAHKIRSVGSKLAFVILRGGSRMVQCVVSANNEEFVSSDMVKYVKGLNRESYIEIVGVVSIPKEPIETTTQQVEVQVRKLNCISRALGNLPMSVEDAGRSEAEFEKAEQTGEQLVRVGQDVRLDNRVLDLRTPANNAIFRIRCFVKHDG